MFKVNGYYCTEWLREDELPLKLEDLNLDSVYENFVRQIANDKLKTETADESLKESVTRNEQKQQLKKEIDRMQAKIRRV